MSELKLRLPKRANAESCRSRPTFASNRATGPNTYGGARGNNSGSFGGSLAIESNCG